MRYQITITGFLDTSLSEETIRRDFPMFVSALADVHPDTVRDSITLVSVEALPEPEPVTDGPTVEVNRGDLAAIAEGLLAVTQRLDRAGI